MQRDWTLDKQADYELISRARAGDGDAFRALTEPHNRELQMHCYRMLGSLQDAEDALQDTLLAAWQGLGSYEGRASIRTWLFKIATNRCLDVLRSAKRRPAVAWSAPEIEPPEPSRLGQIVWLEPFPDALLAGGLGTPLDPEARYEQTEAMSLAFVTALQILPARQRAVLILRDVLGYHAHEVANLLETTSESVTSALKRARASLQRRLQRRLRQPASSRLHQRPTRPRNRPLVHASFRRMSPGASKRWSRCSRTTRRCPCRQFPSSTSAAMPWLASGPASCLTGATGSCRREPMVSPRSGRTFATRQAVSCMAPAC